MGGPENPHALKNLERWNWVKGGVSVSVGVGASRRQTRCGEWRDAKDGFRRGSGVSGICIHYRRVNIVLCNVIIITEYISC
jgi:hypothetical protein